MSIKVPKRTQHCSVCKNHGLNVPKKGHHCPYLNCDCPLCELTKKSQMAMRHQQRVWRHQKQKLKSQKFDDEDMANVGENKTNKSQACDKCRNHNILRLKRNHQCPFQNCQCDYCSLTFKRREIMKHQQRVRRSRITSQVECNATPNAAAEPEEKENEYAYYRGEEAANRPPSRYIDDEESNQEEVRDVQPTHDPVTNERVEHEEDTVTAVPMEHMDTLTPRSDPVEVEPFHQRRFLSHPPENNIPRPEPEEKKIRESPPPLIHVMSNRPSPPQLYPRDSRSVSPHSYFDHSSQRDDSPRAKGDSPSFRYESFHEDLKEDSRQASLKLLQRENSSSSFRSFHFPHSQPLQSLSALNASLETSMNSIKFGAQLEDLHLRNCNWLPSALIGSSFGNISQSTTSLLHPQQAHHQRPQPHQPIRPLPLTMSRPRHPGALPQQLWNHMFLPFNLGLQQNTPESNLERFHGIARNPQVFF